MDLGIAGKVAIVTGATGGIGRACAHALAADGARLALVARTEARLDAVAAEVRARHNASVTTCPTDIEAPAEVALLVERVCAELGSPDILVMITGKSPAPSREVLDENEPERWERAFRHNLMAAVNVISAIAPLMARKGHGRIISVNSATVKQPMPRHGLSTVFRSGLAGYLKHLANEVARRGVTVNSVGPASIATESFLTRADAARRAESVPVGRLGRPEECAAAVAFLASGNAGFITGTTLQVDGGMTASLT